MRPRAAPSVSCREVFLLDTLDEKFFTHLALSTFDRVPFQLTDELLCMEIASAVALNLGPPEESPEDDEGTLDAAHTAPPPPRRPRCGRARRSPRALPLLFLLLLCASPALCRAEPLGEALAEAAAVPARGPRRRRRGRRGQRARRRARRRAARPEPRHRRRGDPGRGDRDRVLLLGGARADDGRQRRRRPRAPRRVAGSSGRSREDARRRRRVGVGVRRRTRRRDDVGERLLLPRRSSGDRRDVRRRDRPDARAPEHRRSNRRRRRGSTASDQTPATAGFTVIVPRDDAWMTDPHHASPATVIRIDVWNLLLCAVIGIVLAVAMLSLVSAWTERHGGGGGGGDDSRRRRRLRRRRRKRRQAERRLGRREASAAAAEDGLRGHEHVAADGGFGRGAFRGDVRAEVLRVRTARALGEGLLAQHRRRVIAVKKKTTRPPPPARDEDTIASSRFVQYTRKFVFVKNSVTTRRVVVGLDALPR